MAIDYNINGSNKADRIKNKAHKYLGLELQDASNKYFRVNPNAEHKDVYAYLGNERKKVNTKYGTKILAQPANTKPLWLADWATLGGDYHTNGGRDALIFKAPPSRAEELKKYAEGHDDLFHINDLAKKRDIRIPKSRAFLSDLLDFGVF